MNEIPPTRIGLPSRCRARLGWFAKAALDLVYPSACALCGSSFDEVERPDSRTQESPSFCEVCLERLVSQPAPRCGRCGAKVSTAPGDHKPRCAGCGELSLHFSLVWPLGDYAGELRRAVLEMKEVGHRPLTHSMARLLAEQRGEEIDRFKPDLIAAVPMYWSQRLRRGVNSAEEIGETLARRLRVPWGPRLLIRRRNTPPQSELSRTGRFENVRDAFRVSKCYQLKATRVLLVDDILTTGATCSEAARMLRQAGAAEVAVAVIAKSVRPGSQ